MHSRAYTSFLHQHCNTYGYSRTEVSMHSRAYTSFLRYYCVSIKSKTVLHSVNALSGLYLISTYTNKSVQTHAAQCQCTLGLIPHFYIIAFVVAIMLTFIVSMHSRAYTSFLRYPFKNLGFMRFPEPVFAGIYQNILTTAVFRAC